MTNFKSRPEQNGKKRLAPLSVRLTPEEIDRLNHDCQGYASRNESIKDRLFSQNGKRPRKPLAIDRNALAQILGLLGASRIANNLNQLAFKANVDSFLFTPEAQAQLQEAYEAIQEMRQLLLQALGYRTV